MVTPQLLDYINKQLSTGVDKDIIKTNLQTSNWSLDDIDAAFKQLQIPLVAAPIENKQTSYFDGGLLQLIGWTILAWIIIVFTLGICYPWALCMLYGWKIKHTVIEEKRLSFNGTGLQLFGNWIKWFLLCVITLGIYSFWVGIALEKWKVKHTQFA